MTDRYPIIEFLVRHFYREDSEEEIDSWIWAGIHHFIYQRFHILDYENIYCKNVFKALDDLELCLENEIDMKYYGFVYLYDTSVKNVTRQILNVLQEILHYLRSKI